MGGSPGRRSLWLALGTWEFMAPPVWGYISWWRLTQPPMSQTHPILEWPNVRDMSWSSRRTGVRVSRLLAGLDAPVSVARGAEEKIIAIMCGNWERQTRPMVTSCMRATA